MARLYRQVGGNRYPGRVRVRFARGIYDAVSVPIENCTLLLTVGANMPCCKAEPCRFRKGHWPPVSQDLAHPTHPQFGNGVPLTTPLAAMPVGLMPTIAVQEEVPGTTGEGRCQPNSCGNTLHKYEAPERLLLKERSCSLFRGDYNVFWPSCLSVLSGMKSQRKHGDS